MQADSKLKEMQEAAFQILKETIKVFEKHNLRYIMYYGSLLGTVRHNGFIPWDDDLDIAMPRADFEKFREIAKTELPPELFFQDYTSDEEYPAVVAKVRNSNTTLIERGYRNLKKMNQGIFIDIFVADYYEPGFVNSCLIKLNRALGGILLSQKVCDINPVRKGISKVFPRNFLFKQIENISKKLDRKGVKKHCLIDNVKTFDIDIFDDVIKWKYEGLDVNIPREYDKVLTSLYGDYMTPPPADMQKPLHMTKHISVDMSYKEYIEKNLI